MLQFRTTEARISGAIYGAMWCGPMGYHLLDARLKGPFGCHQKGFSLADTVDSLLMREGGDFQNASFAADSELIIVRQSLDVKGMRRVHTRTIPLARIAPDLVGDLECGDLMCGEDYE